MSAFITARWFRLSLIMLAFTLAIAAMALAQSPESKTLTDQQKRKEVFHLSEEVAKAEAAGKWDEAVAATEKLLDYLRTNFSEKLEATATVLAKLSEFHEQRADFTSARKPRAEALALHERMHGKDDWRTTDARLALAQVELLGKLSAEQRGQLAEAVSLNRELMRLHGAGKYSEAIALGIKAMESRKQVLGERHPDYAKSLNNLAQVYEAKADYAKALPLCEKSCEIWKQAVGEAHSSYGHSLMSLGALYQAQGDYAKALPLLEKACAIDKHTIGERHADYARSLNNLAMLYDAQGEYAKALPLLEQACEVWKQALGERHPDYAAGLINLAGLYEAQGDYAKAMSLCEKACAILKQELGESHRHYALGLNVLASLYRDQGDYAHAEPLYRRSMEILKKAVGETHPEYASSLNSLAGHYHLDQGDDARAEPLFRQAAAIRKQALGEAHPTYANSLNGLALLYQAQRDYTKALPLFEKVCEVWKQALGETHPHYAVGLNNLALLYQNLGDFTRAEPLYRQALEIRKQALGEAHPDYAASLSSLALLHKEQGDYAKALPLFEKASRIWKEALGETHPRYALGLSNLAGTYQAQGDNARAEPLAHRSLLLSRDDLDATAAVQSERQQLGMADKFRYRLDAYLSVALAAGTPAERIAPFLMQAKGAVFVRQRRQRQLIELSGSVSEAARAAVDLDQTSRRLAALAGRTPQPAERYAWKRDLAELTEKKERLEVDLSRLSADFRAQKTRERLTPEQLRDRLPADVALVDLFEYTHFSPDPKNKGKFVTERRLLAVILRKGKPVALVPLGAVRPIADAVGAWRLTLKRTQPVRGDDDPAALLRKDLWLPLAAHLEGAKTVLISPDGVLAQLPFAALPGSKPGSYLIEEVNLAVVPVPQLLAELLDRKPNDDAGKPSLLVVGAVDYDAEPGKAAPGAASKTGARGGERKQWQPLDGTRAEMAAIKDSFEQRFPDGKVKTLRGAGATEEALREQAPKHRWLHLATHGFFAPPTVKAIGRGDDKTARGSEGFAEQKVTGWHPGLLSGLVLAGANREPDPERDDGILTALEVQALDLRQVELAVLSACQTGLGKVAGGEGLLGLQRAFQVAGARSVVASLWSVDDKATQQLMIRFYENRWDRKMPALEALVEAQRWMLAEGVKRGLVREDSPKTDAHPRTPPYYWAAFVLSGDWR